MIAVHRILHEKALPPPSSSLGSVPSNLQSTSSQGLQAAPTLRRKAQLFGWYMCRDLFNMCMQTYYYEIVSRWTPAICTTFAGFKALKA